MILELIDGRCFSLWIDFRTYYPGSSGHKLDCWGGARVGRTFQRFHVRREQHVTKKLKKFIYDDVKPKCEQSLIHEHLLNNPIYADNYLDNRFEILSRARYTYHLSFLESIFIRTRESKICKQRDFNNLKLYK